MQARRNSQEAKKLPLELKDYFGFQSHGSFVRLRKSVIAVITKFSVVTASVGLRILRSASRGDA